MSSLIHRSVTCLILTGGIFIALPGIAAPGPTPGSQSAKLQPSDRSATEVLEHQVSRAGLWGLEDAEWQRYHVLMQGIRGSVSPATLSPIEVLGIHARNREERKRYAEQWARMMREDAERILAFQRAYDEAQKRLYPDSVLVDAGFLERVGSGPDRAEALGWQPDDRILFFTDTQCAGCNAVLERMLARIGQFSGIDLYLVDVTAGEEFRIREWAAARKINPQWVREHRVTLNIDGGAFEQVLAHTGLKDAGLPALVRKRGNRFTPVSASKF